MSDVPNCEFLSLVIARGLYVCREVTRLTYTTHASVTSLIASSGAPVQ